MVASGGRGIVMVMKCPHCQVAIHEGFENRSFAGENAITEGNRTIARAVTWQTSYQRCPECQQGIVYLVRIITGPNMPASTERILAYPNVRGRNPQPEVPEPYRQNFIEASAVLGISENASAALSRRCLQTLLRDKAGVSSSDLYNEIEEFIKNGKAPSDVEESLHAVRHIGNFAAHPIKSQSTGQIVPVEVGEAEWNLDVLERLFDYFFVGPAITARRKDDLNKKLVEAGKLPIP